MKPTGLGRYTREEFKKRVKNGLNWHEQLRLADLERAKSRGVTLVELLPLIDWALTPLMTKLPREEKRSKSRRKA